MSRAAPVAPTPPPPPAASLLDRRVSFQRSGGGRRTRAQQYVQNHHKAPPPLPRAAPPVVIYRQQPPCSPRQLEQQAEDVVRQLDAIQCAVSTSQPAPATGKRALYSQQTSSTSTAIPISQHRLDGNESRLTTRKRPVSAVSSAPLSRQHSLPQMNSSTAASATNRNTVIGLNGGTRIFGSLEGDRQVLGSADNVGRHNQRGDRRQHVIRLCLHADGRHSRSEVSPRSPRSVHGWSSDCQELDNTEEDIESNSVEHHDMHVRSPWRNEWSSPDRSKRGYPHYTHKLVRSESDIHGCRPQVRSRSPWINGAWPLRQVRQYSRSPSPPPPPVLPLHAPTRLSPDARHKQYSSCTFLPAEGDDHQKLRQIGNLRYKKRYSHSEERYSDDYGDKCYISQHSRPDRFSSQYSRSPGNVVRLSIGDYRNPSSNENLKYKHTKHIDSGLVSKEDSHSKDVYYNRRSSRDYSRRTHEEIVRSLSENNDRYDGFTSFKGRTTPHFDELPRTCESCNRHMINRDTEDVHPTTSTGYSSMDKRSIPAKQNKNKKSDQDRMSKRDSADFPFRSVSHNVEKIENRLTNSPQGYILNREDGKANRDEFKSINRQNSPVKKLNQTYTLYPASTKQKKDYRLYNQPDYSRDKTEKQNRGTVLEKKTQSSYTQVNRDADYKAWSRHHASDRNHVASRNSSPAGPPTFQHRYTQCNLTGNSWRKRRRSPRGINVVLPDSETRDLPVCSEQSPTNCGLNTTGLRPRPAPLVPVTVRKIQGEDDHQNRTDRQRLAYNITKTRHIFPRDVKDYGSVRRPAQPRHRAMRLQPTHTYIVQNDGDSVASSSIDDTAPTEQHTGSELSQQMGDKESVVDPCCSLTEQSTDYCLTTPSRGDRDTDGRHLGSSLVRTDKTRLINNSERMAIDKTIKNRSKWSTGFVTRFLERESMLQSERRDGFRESDETLEAMQQQQQLADDRSTSTFAASRPREVSGVVTRDMFRDTPRHRPAAAKYGCHYTDNLRVQPEHSQQHYDSVRNVISARSSQLSPPSKICTNKKRPNWFLAALRKLSTRSCDSKRHVTTSTFNPTSTMDNGRYLRKNSREQRAGECPQVHYTSGNVVHTDWPLSEDMHSADAIDYHVKPHQQHRWQPRKPTEANRTTKGSSTVARSLSSVSVATRHKQHATNLSCMSPASALDSEVQCPVQESQRHHSQPCQRSVFLHATTVADIPLPSESRSRTSIEDTTPPKTSASTKVRRSFSLLGLFKPRRSRERNLAATGVHTSSNTLDTSRHRRRRNVDTSLPRLRTMPDSEHVRYTSRLVTMPSGGRVAVGEQRSDGPPRATGAETAKVRVQTESLRHQECVSPDWMTYTAGTLRVR